MFIHTQNENGTDKYRQDLVLILNFNPRVFKSIKDNQYYLCYKHPIKLLRQNVEK